MRARKDLTQQMRRRKIKTMSFTRIITDFFMQSFLLVSVILHLIIISINLSLQLTRQ
jgi:hypothetical protein